MPETGYSSMAMSKVQRKLIDLKVALPENNPIKYVQRIDNVIFSHGGVSDYFVREYVPASKYNDIDTVMDTINCLTAIACFRHIPHITEIMISITP